MTIRQDARIIGWPLTILFLPVLWWRYNMRGAGPVKDYYHKAEVKYEQEVYAECSFCRQMRYHDTIIWVLPYTETRECQVCRTITEVA